MQPGSEPIGDDELLYRRVLLEHFDPSASPHPSPLAFRPTNEDTSGLSLSRAKYTSVADAARGRAGKSYYVAAMRAGDLRAAGIEIVPKPRGGQPGHAEIPGLTRETRSTLEGKSLSLLLSQKHCIRVEGPFHSAGSGG